MSLLGRNPALWSAIRGTPWPVAPLIFGRRPTHARHAMRGCFGNGFPGHWHLVSKPGCSIHVMQCIGHRMQKRWRPSPGVCP